MICLSSRAKRAEELLNIERQISKQDFDRANMLSRQVSGLIEENAALCSGKAAIHLELEKAKDNAEHHRRRRGESITARNKMAAELEVAQRGAANMQEEKQKVERLYAASQGTCRRQALEIDEKAARIVELEKKLDERSRALELSRSRVQQLRADYETLRQPLLGLVVGARSTAEWLSDNSSPDSVARDYSEELFDVLAYVDTALNN